MNLLTEQERNLVAVEIERCISNYAFTAIESAVIKKLDAGVKVTPVASFWREKTTGLYPGVSFGLTAAGEALSPGERHKLYTATAIAAARVQALEEAAKRALTIERNRRLLTYEVTNAIRALIGGQE